MLSRQYILSCHLPVHPSYSLVNQGLPGGIPRKYATKEYKESIESFMPTWGLNQTNLKLGTKSIHTADVSSAINNYITNPFTANRPPPIAGLEQELPRRTRTTLVQLISGWCDTIINHYTSRINTLNSRHLPKLWYIPSWCTPSVQLSQETDNTGNNITMDQPQRSSDILWSRHWKKRILEIWNVINNNIHSKMQLISLGCPQLLEHFILFLQSSSGSNKNVTIINHQLSE